MSGHGVEQVRDAIADAIVTLPEQLRRSLTWDQGAEMAQHAKLRIDTGLPVYFCDPQSPWQRATTRTPTASCASTSRRVLISHATLNGKTLGWRTPAEALDQYLAAAD